MNEQKVCAKIDKEILKPEFAEQLSNILSEAISLGYASVTIVVVDGKIKFIEGPTPRVSVKYK